MKKTDWYAPYVWPVHEGVYELLNTSTGVTYFARWIRQGWCVGSLRRDEAERSVQISVVQCRWPWRGVTEPK